MAVRVPAGFCEKAGLTAEDSLTPAGGKTGIPGLSALPVVGELFQTPAANGKPANNGAWALNPREVRMLTALIRAEPGMEILTRPQIMASDEQAARINIGQEIELVTEMEASSKDGVTVYTPKSRKIQLGISITVTPKISADGRFVALKVETEHVNLALPRFKCR